jgi:hypothetical protein
MSIDQLVNQISLVVIPALPYLLKGIQISSQKFVEKLGTDSAGKSMELAQSLWKKISGKKTKSNKLSIAAEELSKTPEDKEWQGMLKKEIKQLLNADPALLKEITLLLKTEVPEQTIVAKRNVKGSIEQSNVGSAGKQKITAEDNSGLVIRQNIKK